MIIRRLLQRLVGEASALRSRQPGWISRWGRQYVLDSSRVDYELARDLYRNVDDRYKLGAAFARPAINTVAGFVGVPTFLHPDAEANAMLEKLRERQAGELLRTNRNVLRDGDAFVRLTTKPSGDIGMVLVPPGGVTPVYNPFTGEMERLVIRHKVPISDENGRQSDTYGIVETITLTERTVKIESDDPALKVHEVEEANPYGFIPVVHFRNEAEEDQVFGLSDLEPLEPFMKAYHDTLIFAVQGSRLFSRPKAKFMLKDVKQFLENNFDEAEIASGKLKFADREIFLMRDGEDVDFITADSGLTGVTALLKMIFKNIVDVSEVPEFAFGTAVASSKASVSEQMVPLERRIKRKRGQLEGQYRELASFALRMWAHGQRKRFEAYDVDIRWDELSPRDDQAVAVTIKTLVEGLSSAVEGGLLSADAAGEFLSDFIPTALPWSDPDGSNDEQRRVVKSLLWRQRLEDRDGWEDILKDDDDS